MSKKVNKSIYIIFYYSCYSFYWVVTSFACGDVVDDSEVHGASVFGVEVSTMKMEASIILLLLDSNSCNCEHVHNYFLRWDAVWFSRGTRIHGDTSQNTALFFLFFH
jgi:hypothetical protein